VLLYHGGFGWARGGFIGVSVFFTLSGFLITGLLMREWDSKETIDLGAFWSRRFRRLLPAALVCLAAICVIAGIAGSVIVRDNLRVDVIAALCYVANWRFVLEGKTYASLFTDPSPVQHFWSLAVEEQFYLLYPLVALAALRVGGRRVLTALLVLGTTASVAWSLHLASNPDRVYYGTDTRAAELLAGGLLAVWWTAGRRSDRAPVWLTAAGAAALGATAYIVVTVSETSRVVTHGLLPLQAVLSVSVIAALVRPGPVSRLLSWRPLTSVGIVSYGIYLYHWPIFWLLDGQRTGLSQVPLFAVRVALTALAAVASYHLVEAPIRHRRVLDGWAGVPAGAGAAAVVATAAVLATVALPPTTLAYADVQLRTDAVAVSNASGVSPTAGVGSAGSAVAAPGAVMIIGDSGMWDVSPALSALAVQEGTRTIVNVSFPGFGFTIGSEGWRQAWPSMIAEYHPSVVYAMLGGWDESYIKAHGIAAYDAILDQASAILTGGGGRILWLGVPPGPLADPAFVDPVLVSYAAAHRNDMAYADPASVLLGPDGKPDRWLPDADGTLELARKPDGWHFCQAGAERVAAFAGAVAGRLSWTPTPVPGWENGAWRFDASRYNNPKGGCDLSSPANAPSPTSQ
jgi:peptidoglycan/LPS O-acetylase OafA/YrhL